MSDSENEVELDVEEPKAPAKTKRVLSDAHKEKLKIARELAQKSKLKSKEKTAIKKENEKLKKEKELEEIKKTNENLKKNLIRLLNQSQSQSQLKKSDQRKKLLFKNHQVIRIVMAEAPYISKRVEARKNMIK